MLEFKKSIAAWAPVRLLDSSTGLPVTGVAFGSVICSVFKPDGTESVLTIGVGDWDEATSGALSGSGTYRVQLPTAALDTLGFLAYGVEVTVPASKFVGMVNVVNNLEADTYTLMVRAMGLMHENSVLDQSVYDGDNNLLSARLRTYDSKANALLAGVGGLVATYSITATYTGRNVTNYTVVREP